MLGNVLFFKKTDSWISMLISKLTKSEYTHVGLIVGYDEKTNAVTIIESDRFSVAKERQLIIDEKKHFIYTVPNKTKDMEEKIVKYAYQCIGIEYDYIQVLWLFFSLIFKYDRYSFFNNANRFICSEIIDLALLKSGAKRLNPMNVGNITPQELLGLYDMVAVVNYKGE